MEIKKFYYKEASLCVILILFISFICTPVFAVDYKEEKEVANCEEIVEYYMKKNVEQYHIAGLTFATIENRKYFKMNQNLFDNRYKDICFYFQKDKSGNGYIVFNPISIKQVVKKFSKQEMGIESIVALFIVVIAILGCILWIINLFRKNKIKYTGIAAWARGISYFSCLLVLMLTVNIFMMFVVKNLVIGNILIISMKFICTLITICTGAMLILGAYVWKKALMPMMSRVFYTMLTLMGAVSVIYIDFMKLLP